MDSNTSFTAEELAYYGSSTIAYKDSTPTKAIQDPAPITQASHPRTPKHIRQPHLRQTAPKISNMPYQGVDLANEAGESSNTVSWQ